MLRFIPDMKIVSDNYDYYCDYELIDYLYNEGYEELDEFPSYPGFCDTF